MRLYRKCQRWWPQECTSLVSPIPCSNQRRMFMISTLTVRRLLSPSLFSFVLFFLHLFLSSLCSPLTEINVFYSQRKNDFSGESRERYTSFLSSFFSLLFSLLSFCPPSFFVSPSFLIFFLYADLIIDHFTLGKIHQDVASFLVAAAEDDETTDQTLIKVLILVILFFSFILIPFILSFFFSILAL